jgi:hypothetical protein
MNSICHPKAGARCGLPGHDDGCSRTLRDVQTVSLSCDTVSTCNLYRTQPKHVIVRTRVRDVNLEVAIAASVLAHASSIACGSVPEIVRWLNHCRNTRAPKQTIVALTTRRSARSIASTAATHRRSFPPQLLVIVSGCRSAIVESCLCRCRDKPFQQTHASSTGRLSNCPRE